MSPHSLGLGRRSVGSSFNLRNLLLFAHIGAVILLIGPITLATSLFPRYAAPGGLIAASALHRVSRAYGFASLAVPGIGVFLAQRSGYLGMAWVNASLGIFTAAFLLLIGVIVPEQARQIAALRAGSENPQRKSLLRASSGIFAITWLVILFLMVAKPS